MELKALSSDGKIAYLIKPILKVLQDAGGQLERSEIKERIADLDDQIAEYAEIEKVSKKSVYCGCAYIHNHIFNYINPKRFIS